MPIPAQNPATVSLNFDSLLVRTLIYDGGDKFNLQLCRFASADGTIQSESVVMTLVDDPTAVAALKGLVSQFIAYKNIPGNLKFLTINGSVNGTTIRAGLRLQTDAAPLFVIPDCYALAATDATFATMLGTFIAAITAYNQTAKVI